MVAVGNITENGTGLVGSCVKTILVTCTNRTCDCNHCLVEAQGAVDCLYRYRRHGQRSINSNLSGSSRGASRGIGYGIGI